MYVYRPQQASGHAPGYSSASTRGHHVGRQAAKNQRRTQPKPRRPQAQHRHRHALSDSVATRQRLRLTAAPMGNASPTGANLGDSLDEPIDGSRRSEISVRARLRARLVKRHCTELEVALERRHGGSWPEHVLRGEFHTIEGMHRICEAFCMRPHIEQQVLKALAERARAIQGSPQLWSGSSTTHKESDTCHNCDHNSEITSLVGSVGGRSKDNPVCCELDTASTSDGESLAESIDGASSEAAWPEDSLEEGHDSPWELVATRHTDDEEVASSTGCGSSSAGSSSECEADSITSVRSAWKSRVMRAIGLQRIWPGRSIPGSHENKESDETTKKADRIDDTKRPNREEQGSDEDEDEEYLLSSKLVAALNNASLHTASERSQQALQRRSSSESISSFVLPDQTASGNRMSESSCCQRSTRIRFASKSEISFFSQTVDQDAPEECLTVLQYRRTLYTKVFDGPSGHKAKRTPSSEAKTPRHTDNEVSARGLWSQSAAEGLTDPEDENSFEEDEDWEDHCDDIAELMGQQRSCMLWSASW